ncbi:hypothetical protein ACWDSD_28730 [Streptomyces spiralis]
MESAGELCAGLLPAYGPVRAVSRFAEGSATGAHCIEFAHADSAPVVLGRLHAVPAHGYGHVHGEIRDPLLDNSAHIARMFERYLREFREHTADPALADPIAAHVPAHASAFAACPRPWSRTWFLDSPAHRRPRSRTQPGGPRRTLLGVPLSRGGSEAKAVPCVVRRSLGCAWGGVS